MIEYLAALEGILTLLRNNVPNGTGVFPAPVPIDGPFPCVGIKLVASKTVSAVGGGSVFIDDMRLEVLCLDKNQQTLDNIDPIAKIVHNCLHNKTVSASDGNLLLIRRMKIINKPYVDIANITWQQLGGEFRVVVNSTP
jgi:hypothetical protein